MTHTMHAFDTLLYAKKLKKVGFSEEQAEVQAEALASIINESLATKQDIRRLEKEFKREMKSMEMRIIFRLSSIMIAVGGFFSGAVIFFSH